MITRENISPGYQVVQSNHSIADFIFEHPVLAQQWKKESNSIINLSVPTEQELAGLSKQLKSKGYYVSEFYEPDIDNQLTAICVYATSVVRKELSHLPLTLKKFSQSKSLNGEAISKNKCATTLN